MTPAKAKVPLVVVDACVVVYAILDDPESKFAVQVRSSRSELYQGETGASRLVIPAVVMAELHGTSVIGGTNVREEERKSRLAKVSDYLDSSHLMYAEIDVHVARLAGELAYDHCLKPGDALVAASAIDVGADVLVTWDKGLLKLHGAKNYPIAVRTPQDVGNQTKIDVESMIP